MAREACLRCRRPLSVCVCRHLEGLAKVDNRTEVVILQHRRERLHPFGTVRIVRMGLGRVRVEVVGSGSRSLERPLALPPGTGLLYPGPNARPLEALSPAERPPALVVLDGTWHHAKRLYRANERWLGRLPCYRLTPAEPGRYRIRAEPDAESVSTVEAVVAALRILEPETVGLERLLGAFEAMVDDQLAVRDGHEGQARRRTRRRPRRPLAGPLVERFDDLVVVYAESARDAGARRRLVRWSAVHPASGRLLDHLLRWRGEGELPRASHLAHMGLTPAELAGGVEPAWLAGRWRDFAGERPLVAAWSRRPLDLVDSPAAGDCLEIKAAYCNERGGRCGSLGEVVTREGLAPAPVPIEGRAARRLACTVAVVELLRRRLGASDPVS